MLPQCRRNLSVNTKATIPKHGIPLGTNTRRKQKRNNAVFDIKIPTPALRMMSGQREWFRLPCAVYKGRLVMGCAWTPTWRTKPIPHLWSGMIAPIQCFALWSVTPRPIMVSSRIQMLLSCCVLNAPDKVSKTKLPRLGIVGGLHHLVPRDKLAVDSDNNVDGGC